MILGFIVFDLGDVFITNDGGRANTAGVEFVANVDDLLRRKWRARADDTIKDGTEFGLGANVAVGWEIVDYFEGDVAAKNNDRIKGYNSAENCGDGGNMRGVLAHGAIKLMLVFAVSGNLGPVDTITMAINPAEVTLGFKDEDSPFVHRETVNLE